MQPYSVERQKRKNRGKIPCITGLLASCGLFVLSRLSQVWLPLDFLSHFTVHLAVIAVACMIGYFMPLERTLTTISLLLIGFISIGYDTQDTSNRPRQLTALQEGEKQLRLLTFNTNINNRDTDAIGAEIRRLAPDVAVLIEFSEAKRAVLDHLGNLYPYSAGCVAGRHCHFAVLSKVPIIASEVREGWKGPLMVRARLGGAFSGFDIVGVHLTRFPHIRAQFAQMALLTKYLHQLPGRYVVMGDFNATPFSKLLSDFSDHLQLRRLTSMPTWPAIADAVREPIRFRSLFTAIVEAPVQ